MKRLMLVFVLLISIRLNAQCVNNVSTNPTNPTNNALPELDNGDPYDDVDTRYLNRFDWLPANGSIFYQYNLFNTTTKNLKK